MENLKLFSKYILGNIELKNRIVMAPMTRSRAESNVPNALMAKYYKQRSGAGLIITEGTAPSANGLGYARIPGLFNESQIEGWKLVTTAVHQDGAKIFAQLMHTGRISHSLNMPANAEIIAPSAIQAAGQMYTDQEGMKDHPVPKEMALDDITKAKKEFVQASTNAVAAGFDGVELHAANGYLLEEFLNPNTNQRNDLYGGSVTNRIKLILEIAREVSFAIGSTKVGIRFSPYGTNSDMKPYNEIDETYELLAKGLSEIGIVYIHIVDHSSMGAPNVPSSIKDKIKSNFKGTYILSGGYDLAKAEADLNSDKGDLVAFGRPFISNPDLVERFKTESNLNNDLKSDLLYTPGPVGYTDYPDLNGKVS